MNSIDFHGVDSSYIPLSKAFFIDIVNHELNLFSLDKINNVNFSIENKLFNKFNLNGKNYVSILLNFKIRINYISDCNILKFNNSSFDKLIHICIGDAIVNSNTKIYSDVLNCDVFDISNSLVNLSLIFACSLGI